MTRNFEVDDVDANLSPTSPKSIIKSPPPGDHTRNCFQPQLFYPNLTTASPSSPLLFSSLLILLIPHLIPHSLPSSELPSSGGRCSSSFFSARYSFRIAPADHDSSITSLRTLDPRAFRRPRNPTLVPSDSTKMGLVASLPQLTHLRSPAAGHSAAVSWRGLFDVGTIEQGEGQ